MNGDERLILSVAVKSFSVASMNAVVIIDALPRIAKRLGGLNRVS